MIRPHLHYRREDLFSILRGLELQIAKDKQNKQDYLRLEQAKQLIEVELGLRHPVELAKVSL